MMFLFLAFCEIFIRVFFIRRRFLLDDVTDGTETLLVLIPFKCVARCDQLHGVQHSPGDCKQPQEGAQSTPTLPTATGRLVLKITEKTLRKNEERFKEVIHCFRNKKEHKLKNNFIRKKYRVFITVWSTRVSSWSLHIPCMHQ